MMEPMIVIATASLVGLMVVVGALLKGWQDWLALKRRELDSHGERPLPPEGSTLGSTRIELSDLKERIRKLEAIASGVDL